MEPTPTAQAGLYERVGAWPAVALTLLVASCGGKAESPATPGSSFQMPGAARATPAVPSASGGGVPLLPPETCAENPLLAMCKPPRSSVSTPSVPPELATPSPDLSDPSLAPVERAEALLGARCGSCHGAPDPRACGACDGMRNIDDLGKMIKSGRIVPCNWRGSRIYQRIARGEMPPRYSNGPPPTPEELSILASFVDGLCEDLTAGDPVVSGQRAIESWLASDCGSCHGNTPADAGAAARVPLVDISEMVEQGVLVPCNPEGSLLVQRLRDDSMPPPGVSPRPTADELRDLVTFLERPCSRR